MAQGQESAMHFWSPFSALLVYRKQFVEQHPKYSRYHYEIRALLQKYFEVIYHAVNKSNNNETRVICNVAKELAYGLLGELQDIKSAVEQLDKKIDVLVNEPEYTPTKFLFEEFQKHLPIICQTEEKDFSDHEQIMQTIKESYLRQGRTANRLTTTRTGFIFTTTSRRTGGDDPLSDYVYKSIEESLEDVFGPM